MRATFVSDGNWPGITHDYGQAERMLGEGKDVITSQMGLLASPLMRECDTIRIHDTTGTSILIRRQDGWLSQQSRLRIKASDNLFTLWRSGNFRGRKRDMRPTVGDTEFYGTISECEAYVRRTSDIVRAAKEGMGLDGDAIEREVWHLSMVPTSIKAPTPVRAGMVADVELIRAERDLSRLLSSPLESPLEVNEEVARSIMDDIFETVDA